MGQNPEQYFSLRWNNYQGNMTTVFHQLLQTQSFVDVSLACENQTLQAHKMVLSACSAYFKKILLDNPCQHPTIIMPADIRYEDLSMIISFIYRGEVDVPENGLQLLFCPLTMEHMMATAVIKTEPDWMLNDDEYVTADLYQSDGTISYTEYEIRPFDYRFDYEPDLDFEDNGNAGLKYKTILHTAEQLQIKGLCEISDSNDQTIDGSDTNIVTVVAPPPPALRRGGRFAVKRPRTNVSDSFRSDDQHEEDQEEQNDESQTWFTVNDHPECDEVLEDDDEAGQTGDVFINTANSENGNVVVLDQQVLTPSGEPTGNNGKGLGNLQLGMNGGIMGVSMGFLDFAPEPAAPTATPVTENVDISCTPSMDTRDLTSTPNGEVRIETLRSLDQEPLSITPIKKKSQPSFGTKPQPNKQPADAIVITPKTSQPKGKAAKAAAAEKQKQQQQQQQDLQQQLEQDLCGEDQQMIMEIDPIDIKREGTMMMSTDVAAMMGADGHLVDMYHSDPSDDANSKQDLKSSLDFMNMSSTQADIKPLGPKTWTQESMDSALEALRSQNMSLTKASVSFGIPSTTLWQRAHRLGIDTPKKEGPTKSWSEDSLNNALDALRTGKISANKASKAYGIPSSTLYKIARREGIRLAAPFNAAPTTWSAEELERALVAIRSGATSVQKASLEFGIPTGTLYGRCKREGIELSRSNPTPWSEEAMMEALESVRLGQMSINQAAIHFNLPYSSLYGRFKRGKYDVSLDSIIGTQIDQSPDSSFQYDSSFQSPGGDQSQQDHQHQHDMQAINVSTSSMDDQHIQIIDGTHHIEMVEEMHHDADQMNHQIIYQTVKTEQS